MPKVKTYNGALLNSEMDDGSSFIYILGKRRLEMGKMMNWVDRIERFKEKNDWKYALCNT